MENATRFTDYRAYVQLALHKLWKRIAEGGSNQPERIESPVRGVPGVVQKWKDFWHTGASEVAKHLYVGSAADAASATTLAQLNIKLVVNCTPDIPNFFEGEDGAPQYARVPIEDGPGVSFREYATTVRDAVHRIQRVRSAGGNVLVHCLMGASRSVCVACLTLLNEKDSVDVADEKEAADKVYDTVRTARAPARINVSFMDDLRTKRDWWWGEDTPTPLDT